MRSEKNSSNRTGISADALISLSSAAEMSSLTADHLRRLVEQGKIWGMKIGRNWVTTREAVDEYKQQKHPRGPKSKMVENP